MASWAAWPGAQTPTRRPLRPREPVHRRLRTGDVADLHLHAAATESQGGAVTFTNATIVNPRVQVPTGAQGSQLGGVGFTSTSFALDAAGFGPFSATVTVDLVLDGGAGSVQGSATSRLDDRAP